ncbi:GTP-dependent dephospho-CoA kinase family protein [Candidatus Micrarchaeota archaeon]|nr:GTP-dependent dephospho-CoA kinase family protein [Candidatus Micrarchaeota archaeon]
MKKLLSRARGRLKKPLGRLLDKRQAAAFLESCKKHKPFLVTVGDATTGLALGRGISPSVSVVDLKIAREKVEAHHVKQLLLAGAVLLEAKNAPGTISVESEKKIAEAIKFSRKGKKVILLIDGEEDLLTLPAIVSAPVGALVLYGQPGEGLVAVEVTAGKKGEIRKILGTGFG